jgi:hypothetical protein
LYISGTYIFKDNSDLRHPTLTLPTREGTIPILIPSLVGRVRVGLYFAYFRTPKFDVSQEFCGVYYFNIISGNWTKTKKMIFVK